MTQNLKNSKKLHTMPLPLKYHKKQKINRFVEIVRRERFFRKKLYEKKFIFAIDFEDNSIYDPTTIF